MLLISYLVRTQQIFSFHVIDKIQELPRVAESDIRLRLLAATRDQLWTKFHAPAVHPFLGIGARQGLPVEMRAINSSRMTPEDF